MRRFLLLGIIFSMLIVLFSCQLFAMKPSTPPEIVENNEKVIQKLEELFEERKKERKGLRMVIGAGNTGTDLARFQGLYDVTITNWFNSINPSEKNLYSLGISLGDYDETRSLVKNLEGLFEEIIFDLGVTEYFDKNKAMLLLPKLLMPGGKLMLDFFQNHEDKGTYFTPQGLEFLPGLTPFAMMNYEELNALQAKRINSIYESDDAAYLTDRSIPCDQGNLSNINKTLKKITIAHDKKAFAQPGYEVKYHPKETYPIPTFNATTQKYEIGNPDLNYFEVTKIKLPHITVKPHEIETHNNNVIQKLKTRDNLAMIVGAGNIDFWQGGKLIAADYSHFSDIFNVTLTHHPDQVNGQREDLVSLIIDINNQDKMETIFDELEGRFGMIVFDFDVTKDYNFDTLQSLFKALKPGGLIEISSGPGEHEILNDQSTIKSHVQKMIENLNNEAKNNKFFLIPFSFDANAYYNEFLLLMKVIEHNEKILNEKLLSSPLISAFNDSQKMQRDKIRIYRDGIGARYPITLWSKPFISDTAYFSIWKPQNFPLSAPKSDLEKKLTLLKQSLFSLKAKLLLLKQNLDNLKATCTSKGIPAS